MPPFSYLLSDQERSSATHKVFNLAMSPLVKKNYNALGYELTELKETKTTFAFLSQTIVKRFHGMKNYRDCWFI